MRALLAIAVHLRLQGSGAVEAAVAADEIDELDLDLASVEVAVEVEQEHLEDRRAVVEGRTRAEIGGAVVWARRRPCTRTA